MSDLVPLHERFARELDAMRLGLGTAEARVAAQLYEKTLRYERLVGRIENRIRIAMLRLAQERD